MNKYLYYENKVCFIIESLSKKYNCSIQIADNTFSNACIISLDNRYIVFVSSKLDKRLLPLTILHEFGHIYYKTIKKNPKKYNYFSETLSNFYAIKKLLFSFPFYKRIILIFLTFFSEKKLYKYFINNTNMGGNVIYEKLFTNE